MALLTGNFTAFRPLSRAVAEAIHAALLEGWADPRHLSQASHRAALLKRNALDELAARLRVNEKSIHIVGETALLPFLAIDGYLKAENTLFYSELDQGKVRAVAKSHKGKSVTLKNDSNGEIFTSTFPDHSIVHIQSTNAETGICQSVDSFMGGNHITVVDATHEQNFGSWLSEADASYLDSYSWGGPSGLGFLIINNEEKYTFPIPHIAPIKVPGSYSLPLLIGAAIALDEFQNEKSRTQAALKELRAYVIDSLSTLENVIVAQSTLTTASNKLSFIVNGHSSDEILHQLNARGLDCDAGSACSPSALAPSHVIKALGYQTEGHMRLTLHHQHTKESIDTFIKEMKSILQ